MVLKLSNTINKFYKIYQIPFLIILSLLISKSSELTCDKVATLPKEFDNLIPNYQYLPKVHLFNYFF